MGYEINNLMYLKNAREVTFNYQNKTIGKKKKNIYKQYIITCILIVAERIQKTLEVFLIL